MTRRPLLAANWKMFKTVAQSVAYGRELIRRLETSAGLEAVDVLICPTSLSLWPLAQRVAGTAIRVGAQNLDLGSEGAMTGAVSGYLLREAGAEFVIVGHSERRQYFEEDDATVAKKVQAAIHAHLQPVLCVGETWQERQQDRTVEVIGRQVASALEGLGTEQASRVVVAYEPIWAIGTGSVPTPQDANQVAMAIRRLMPPEIADATRILYGGSVSPKNIRDFASQSDIDGALVGGASLEAGTLMAMIELMVS